jgi:imidazoleglycerol phosphate dehydratase HisB
MSPRQAQIKRQTKETQIELGLNLDGSGVTELRTGVGFLDHMMHSLVTHARFDLELRCAGDVHVDDHHNVEDCALAFGQALRECLGDRRGVRRFGSAHAPLDEALARAIVDLSGRPFAVVNLGLERERLGDVACENLAHFLHSLAMAANICLHVDVLRGLNDHHRAEAAFKATALALREAVQLEGTGIPSTKGMLA